MGARVQSAFVKYREIYLKHAKVPLVLGYALFLKFSNRLLSFNILELK